MIFEFEKERAHEHSKHTESVDHCSVEANGGVPTADEVATRNGVSKHTIYAWKASTLG